MNDIETRMYEKGTRFRRERQRDHTALYVDEKRRFQEAANKIEAAYEKEEKKSRKGKGGSASKQEEKQGIMPCRSLSSNGASLKKGPPVHCNLNGRSTGAIRHGYQA